MAFRREREIEDGVFFQAVLGEIDRKAEVSLSNSDDSLNAAGRAGMTGPGRLGSGQEICPSVHLSRWGD